LFYEVYECSNENGQSSLHHTDFFATCVEHGVLERDVDVVVWDNWSAHTGLDGQELRDVLQDDWGIACVPLPAKFSELNSVEHCWRRVKSRARRMIAEYVVPSEDVVVRAMIEGLESIKHRDIVVEMEHDGYVVEVEAVSELMRAGLW